MRSPALPALTLAGALALAGCSDSADPGDAHAELSVSAAYMPQPVSDDMAAGFLTLTNRGGTKAELTSVTSDLGEVTVHETVDSAMREVKRLTVPAHGRLVFKSGGSHLMFEKLKRKPQQGETVSVELHFAQSDPVTVAMPVKPATYTPKTGH
ncbi:MULTISPECIES: copper chaperone PCu(A)C [unclassified Streptomyces]|uniref:copper chaperone PCu(A)C n=1 Tax=unclassified Streptomyces TaxID=2593676 RepID=UPI0036E3724A